MNPFQALKFMQNPLGAMQQQMLEKMQKSNPQKFQQVKDMLNGKSPEQQKEMFMNLAKERGIDVNQFASQFGIKL